MNEEARGKAFDEYFEDVFGEVLRQKQIEGEDKLRKTRKAVQAFRFICPSYYIPGKQGWGAF